MSKDNEKKKRVFLTDGYKAPKDKSSEVETRGYKAPTDLKSVGKPPSTGSVVKSKRES